VQKFLDTNLEYKDNLSLESFSFTMPKIVEETIFHISAWKTKKELKSMTKQMLQAARTVCNNKIVCVVSISGSKKYYSELVA
jgi:hypothetical protein